MIDQPIGGKILTAGSSIAFKTGSWKTFQPVWNKKKCTQCLLCPVYCPENCIPAKNDQRKETDQNYCKGCGICAQVCPVKCIEMKKTNDNEKPEQVE